MVWQQKGSDIDSAQPNDIFAFSICASSNGNIVGIGSPRHANKGQVCIYQWNGINWNQLGSCLDGVALGDNFGYYIDLNGIGDTIVIGSHRADMMTQFSTGMTQVFHWDGSD